MSATVEPVDPRAVSADNALVEILRARRPVTGDRLVNALAAGCAEVDTGLRESSTRVGVVVEQHLDRAS